MSSYRSYLIATSRKLKAAFHESEQSPRLMQVWLTTPLIQQLSREPLNSERLSLRRMVTIFSERSSSFRRKRSERRTVVGR